MRDLPHDVLKICLSYLPMRESRVVSQCFYDASYELEIDYLNMLLDQRNSHTVSISYISHLSCLGRYKDISLLLYHNHILSKDINSIILLNMIAEEQVSIFATCMTLADDTTIKNIAAYEDIHMWSVHNQDRFLSIVKEEISSRNISI